MATAQSDLDQPLEQLEQQREERDRRLIEEARELVTGMDSSMLRVGRLALEFAPMGEAGYRSGAGERVGMFSEGVGLETSTIKVYRSVAHAWNVTDVRDDELPFAVLQALVSVGDKEGLLEALRNAQPPDGKPRWTGPAAIRFAHDNGFIRSMRKANAGKSQTATPRSLNLSVLGETLRKMSFTNVTVENREELDPLLAKVEAETARLRRELNAVTESARRRRA